MILWCVLQMSYHQYNQKREARGLSSRAEEKGDSFPKSIPKRKKFIPPKQQKQVSLSPGDQSQILMKRNLEAALSEGTKKIYNRWWSKFSQFCDDRGEVPERADPFLVGRFLSRQGEAHKGLGGVDQARAAIRWGILMARPSKKSPTDSPLIQGVIKGMKRRFFKPVVKKAPFSRGNLKTFLEEIVGQKRSGEIPLKDWRLAAELSLMYLTFSRFEEAKELTLGQVVEEGQDLVVTFKKGKQYQFGEARTSVMAGDSGKNEKLDPVGVVKTYMALLVQKVGRNPNQCLFPVLTGKTAWRKPAAYSVVRSQFKFWMQRAGLSEKVAHNKIYDEETWLCFVEVITLFSLKVSGDKSMV